MAVRNRAEPTSGRTRLRRAREVPFCANDARRGSTALLLLALLVLVGMTVGGVFLFNRRAKVDPSKVPLVQAAVSGPFDHVVLEHGEVESSSNIEVICEVKSKGSAGTAIISVIPEGTPVEPGDKLVTLDSSALEEELQEQKIVVNTSRALKIGADALLERATISREEYLKGTFLQEEKTILNEILIAEEKLSRAKESAKFSQRLAALGFQTALQLKADLFAVEQANVELELAQNKLETLRDITKRKMLVEFDSDIEAAQATMEAESDSYQEEVKKLKDIEQQIENCVIYAPAKGQVVYANIVSRRGGTEFVVEAGSLVRERQAIIRLPDASKMQVTATINESRITLVREGMPVGIRIGAFSENRVLSGNVRKVNKYAEPGSWFSSQVKEYATYVDIENPPADIRTGMTAEVRILVEHLDDALQVPVQAICEHKGLTFCLVKTATGWETREITMGATNDKTVVIDAGLSEGEEVVLNPRRHKELLELPDLPDPPKLREQLNTRDESVGRRDDQPDRDDDSTQVAEAQEQTTSENRSQFQNAGGG